MKNYFKIIRVYVSSKWKTVKLVGTFLEMCVSKTGKFNTIASTCFGRHYAC